VQDYRLQVQSFQESRYRLSRSFVVAMNHENLSAHHCILKVLFLGRFLRRWLWEQL